MFGSSRYNYDEFSRTNLLKDVAKAKSISAPDPGDRAPDFELHSLDDGKVRLSDFHDETNVVLIFGSATCPLTAGSIGALQDLYEEFSSEGVEFLFVYVREAHPGERLPAHRNMQDKVKAATLLRDEEHITFPVLIDDLSGKVHRKYGSLPNSTFLIDRSGRIAFRSLATRTEAVREALQELLQRQQERNVDHAVVRGGEAKGFPPVASFLHSYRALERGGDHSIEQFRHEFGLPGRVALFGSRVASPLIEHPRGTAATIAAVAAVLGLGFWVGGMLRRRRFERGPYSGYDYSRSRSQRTGTDDYEAMGI